MVSSEIPYSMMDERWMDDAIIAKLHQDFSSLSTMNTAREELKNLYQEPGEPITVFIYKYGQMHYLSTGIRAHQGDTSIRNNGIHCSIGTQKLNKNGSKEVCWTQERNLTLLRLFFRWQNDVPRRC